MKIFRYVCVIAALFAMTACGGGGGSSSSAAPTPAPTPTPTPTPTPSGPTAAQNATAATSGAVVAGM